MSTDANTKTWLTVAKLSMRLGRRHLSRYSSIKSRHDFTQRQLMACLILRAYTKTTYRGIIELLAVSGELRAALGLSKLPHYVESFISALKRTTGSTLNARREKSLFIEAAFRVLAYALRR